MEHESPRPHGVARARARDGLIIDLVDLATGTRRRQVWHAVVVRFCASRRG